MLFRTDRLEAIFRIGRIESYGLPRLVRIRVSRDRPDLFDKGPSRGWALSPEPRCSSRGPGRTTGV